MWKKRLCQTMAIFATVIALAGCGSEKAVEVYSFGEQALQAGSSTVTMPVPFPLLGKAGATPKQMKYEGADQNINVLILSQPITENGVTLTPQKLADNTAARLSNTPNVHDLKKECTEGTMEGKKAVYLDVQYVDRTQGKEMPLSLRSVYFLDNDQIWSVLYFYQTNDALGKDVADHIWSKIRQ